MDRFRRPLALAASLLIALVVALVPTAASAAPPIDPAFPGSWAKWTFHADGWYWRALDVTRSGGDGAAVQLYDDHGGSNQIWFQEAAAEGGQFLHPGYNRWLCLGRTGTGWGTPVIVQNCNGSVNQRWSIPREEHQRYLLRPWNDPGVCVDVPNSNTAQGQNVQLWGCNGTLAQSWAISQCYGYSCDGQWPDIQDCDTGGADEVGDEAESTNRIVLIFARGCNAFYALATHSVQSVLTAEMRLYRFHTDGTKVELALPVSPGQTRWSPMLAIDEAGATFQACFSEDPGLPVFCTALWWG